MNKTYTKREIAYKLGCSERTIEDDARYLNIKPTIGDRNRNLYSQHDFELLVQMRQHCAIAGNSRDSFAPTPAIEIVEKTPKVTKLIPKVDLVRENYTSSLSFGMQNDPLFDLEILQRISDNRWLLPANRLAPLFNISPKYLNTKKQYEYCGFVATKEVYSSVGALWKVSANNS